VRQQLADQDSPELGDVIKQASGTPTTSRLGVIGMSTPGSAGFSEG